MFAARAGLGGTPLQQPSLRRRLFLGAAPTAAGVAVVPRMPSVCGTPPGATPAATPGFSPSPLTHLFQLPQTARQQPGRFRASLDCQSAHRQGPGGTRRSLPASLDASTSGHAAPPALLQPFPVQVPPHISRATLVSPPPALLTLRKVTSCDTLARFSYIRSADTTIKLTTA